jgi:hypothetical protein
MTFIVKNGGYYIHYSDTKTDNQFLAPDGVHLNELGNNILLNIIQGAMDQFRNDVAFAGSDLSKEAAGTFSSLSDHGHSFSLGNSLAHL